MIAAETLTALQVTCECASYGHIMPPDWGGKVLNTPVEYVTIIVTGKSGQDHLSALVDTLLLSN